MERTTNTIESLLVFVKELEEDSLAKLVEELEKKPNKLAVYYKRSEAQWERLYGPPGIDIYNELHTLEEGMYIAY